MFFTYLLFSFFSIAFCHFGPEERKALPFNSTVVNCGQFGRSHLQHKCVLTPEAMEGPYFIHEDLQRSYITEGKPGIPLKLDIIVTDANNCSPIKEAKVYIWHCDARGWYSGFLKNSPDEPAPPVSKADPSDPSRFMRGVQSTDESGKVTFRTIYPGFYYGRAIHIHIEIYNGGNAVYVGQVYFPEELNKKLEDLDEYGNRNINRTLNERDGVYRRQNGKDTTLKLNGNFESFSTSIILGIDPTKTTSQKPRIRTTAKP